MPRLKIPRQREPLWKAWEYAAQKRGLRHTIFWVNGDQYIGDWRENMKHGKGSYMWKESGQRYDGDWKNNRQSGFGTLSYPDGKGGFSTKYSGSWLNGKRHGYGTEYYGPGEYYEGEWVGDERCGWGRMYYRDGSTFEGEWVADRQGGPGMHRMVNENRYEGSFRNGLKNGPGTYYYLQTGQVFDGVWVDNIPKCGVMRDYDRERAPEPTQYPIPQIELANSEAVIAEAEDMFLPDQTLIEQ